MTKRLHRCIGNPVKFTFALAVGIIHSPIPARAQVLWPTPVFDATNFAEHEKTVRMTIKQIEEIEKKIAEYRKLVRVLERNAKKAENFFSSSLPSLTEYIKNSRSETVKSIGKHIEAMQTIRDIMEESCEQEDKDCLSEVARTIRISSRKINEARSVQAAKSIEETVLFEEQLEIDSKTIEAMESENHISDGEMASLDAANQISAEEAAQLAKLRAELLRSQEEHAIELQQEAMDRANTQRRFDRFRNVPKK